MYYDDCVKKASPQISSALTDSRFASANQQVLNVDGGDNTTRTLYVGNPTNCSDIIFETKNGNISQSTLRNKAGIGEEVRFSSVHIGSTASQAFIYTENEDINFRYKNANGDVTYTSINNMYNALMAKSGGTFTGNVDFGSINTGSRGISGIVGSNDYWRVVGAAGAENAGILEIATADDANEPILVRQYSGAFASVAREAYLLDGSGNTSFPGSITSKGQAVPRVSVSGTTLTLSTG